MIRFDQAQLQPAFGGTGGQKFSDAGNSTEALVGIKIWFGAVIDSIQPIFGLLNDDGTIGVAQTNGSRLLRYGTRFGGANPGQGEPPAELLLSGHVVVGVWVKFGDVVDTLQLVWHEWSASGVTGVDVLSSQIGGSGGGPPRCSRAPSGHLATVVHGASGTRLDTLGIMSARATIIPG